MPMPPVYVIDTGPGTAGGYSYVVIGTEECAIQVQVRPDGTPSDVLLDMGHVVRRKHVQGCKPMAVVEPADEQGDA